MEGDKPAYPFIGKIQGPQSYHPKIEVQYDGLTKRELIAAMAMQGVLSNSAMTENIKKTASPEMIDDPEQTVILKAYAKLATDSADHLLEQLNKG